MQVGDDKGPQGGRQPNVERLRATAATLAALLALALAAPARATLRVGLADSDSATFSDPAYAALRVHDVRAVVPYDVALTPATAGTPAGDRRIEFDHWVDGARATGARPLVTFERSLDPAAFDADGRPVRPSPARYAEAMRAFLAAYPTVRDLAPWNEPNFRDDTVNPFVRAPAAAARLWRTLHAACRGCRVAAGEFAGIPGDSAYITAYRRALGRARPAIWSFHAHADANAFEAGTDRSAPATRFFLRALPGRLWIDEAGAYFRDAAGTVQGDIAQRDATSLLLGLARLSHRIERLYYYNLSNQCSTATRCAVQDRGLVAPLPFDARPGDALDGGYDLAGRTRPAYDVIRARRPVILPTAAAPVRAHRRKVAR